MNYVKQTWEDLPSTNTPITASRLNHIEDGIYNASNSKYDELYNNDTGSTSISVSSDYDFYLVRVGASSTESMIVTIIDGNTARYKYTSTHDESYSITFSIQHNLTTENIIFTRINSSSWGSDTGKIFKIYGVKI